MMMTDIICHHLSSSSAIISHHPSVNTCPHLSLYVFICHHLSQYVILYLLSSIYHHIYLLSYLSLSDIISHHMPSSAVLGRIFRHICSSIDQFKYVYSFSERTIKC